ncbi:transcriptional regulator [Paenilisteria newyorkensis]|nr:transcriptional regulator [Listeria newyorkensis]
MVISNRPTKTTAGNPFFSEIIHSISAIAEDQNFDLILQTSRNTDDELDKCIAKIKEKMIKGIIMLSSPADESFFEKLDPFNIPIVVTGKIDGNYTNVYSVDTDNFKDSYELTNLLIQNGHKNIACLHAPLNHHVSIDRLAGYRSCLFDHNLDIRRDWILDSGYTAEDAYNAAHQLLSHPDRPTAIFATDDLKVLSIYKVASEHNLQIPHDLSIVGYNDRVVSSFLSPPLTAIDIPTKRLGKAATELLFNLIQQNGTPIKNMIIETKLINGASISHLNA